MKARAATQKIAEAQVGMAAIRDAFARGATSLDLLVPLGAVRVALDAAMRALAHERLRALYRRRAHLSDRERHELATIIMLLKPWDAPR